MPASSSTTTSASLFLLFLFFGFSIAKEFLVGGKTDAWNIPSSQSDSLNQWAQRSRFQVGDYLVWKYEGGKDSVLEVSREDYVNCSISNPIKEHSDGTTKVKLDHPGPFYFISGAKGHCEKGQKLVVVVLTPREKSNTGPVLSPAPAPSPSSAEFEAPAVAPTSSANALNGAIVMALGLVAVWGFSILVYQTVTLRILQRSVSAKFIFEM
ncbi:Early nodulin-like protein 1, partial [Mucuna pruriens]